MRKIKKITVYKLIKAIAWTSAIDQLMGMIQYVIRQDKMLENDLMKMSDKIRNQTRIFQAALMAEADGIIGLDGDQDE